MRTHRTTSRTAEKRDRKGGDARVDVAFNLCGPSVKELKDMLSPEERAIMGGNPLMQCRSCRLKKPLSHFYERAAAGKHFPDCRACMSKRHKQKVQETVMVRLPIEEAKKLLAMPAMPPMLIKGLRSGLDRKRKSMEIEQAIPN